MLEPLGDNFRSHEVPCPGIDVAALRAQLAAAQGRIAALEQMVEAVRQSPCLQPCSHCDAGRIVVPEHAMDCQGECRNCPVPVEAMCESCAGTGLAVPEFAPIRDALAALEKSHAAME